MQIFLFPLCQSMNLINFARPNLKVERSSDMKGIEWKRIWMSRILLAVFVPMLMLSVFHIHTEGLTDDIGCNECMHHVRHSHFSTADFCSLQCVQCQFQTLPFIVAGLTVICIPLAAQGHITSSVCHRVIARTAEVISLRAPPIC